jgi:hypothetical protein
VSASRQPAREKRCEQVREKIVIVANAMSCGIGETMTHTERAWLVMAGPSWHFRGGAAEPRTPTRHELLKMRFRFRQEAQ